MAIRNRSPFFSGNSCAIIAAPAVGAPEDQARAGLAQRRRHRLRGTGRVAVGQHGHGHRDRIRLGGFDRTMPLPQFNKGISFFRNKSQTAAAAA